MVYFVFNRYAIFKGCNLCGANLSYCNFERTDFSEAVLDGAILQGVRMVCANMERASLQKCTFEDPAGYLANMEGTNNLIKSTNNQNKIKSIDQQSNQRTIK